MEDKLKALEDRCILYDHTLFGGWDKKYNAFEKGIVQEVHDILALFEKELIERKRRERAFRWYIGIAIGLITALSGWNSLFIHHIGK